MNNYRRDNKNRILKSGESQRKDGRYMYKFKDIDGHFRYVYSWKLVKTDRTPRGKKDTLSLRELENNIQRDLVNNISYSGGNMNVLQLVKFYTKQKYASKYKTTQKYEYVIKLLQNDNFGQLPANKVRLSDAKLWIIRQQQIHNKSYNTISTIRNVIKPAFQLAVDDDLIRKNPFNFKLTGLIRDDRKSKTALSPIQEQLFLKFVREHPIYNNYYDEIFFLFKTGLRISEFTGLTIDDIDFDSKCINVDHQLLYIKSDTYKISVPKSNAGIRKIPMLSGVEPVCHRIVSKCMLSSSKIELDGKRNFLFLNRSGNLTSPQRWDSLFRRVLNSYNESASIPISMLSPHICRHTFCSNMAKSGMNPKVLQYIMGHEDVSVTLNVYTHLNILDVKSEIERLGL